MGTKMVRVGQIYGRGKLIPVGRTKFYEDIVHDENGPEIQFIPGTNIPRLRLTNLSEKVRVGFEDEIAALTEALRKLRDARTKPDTTKATKDQQPTA
jgi:hypothetical protein